MRAYRNYRFQSHPDVGDVQADGRKSSVGRLRRGESFNYYGHRWNDTPKVCHNDRGYNRNTVTKAATRRYLKRADRAADIRFNNIAEGES